MWRPWGKSTVKIHDTSSSSSSSTSTSTSTSPFSCSTFKDIQHLCVDDPTPVFSSSKKTASVFHRVRLANSLLRAWSTRPTLPLPEPEPNATSAIKPPTKTEPEPEQEQEQEQPRISIPGIVIYFTSLRVVRPTFEDCSTVRSILRGFRVSIDERDLSMDSSFLTELQGILGGGGQSKLTLPRVFIGGRYIGGAEEIKQLHETGELKKFVEGMPVVEPGVCDVCGGYWFVLCDECNGSHKMYTEKTGFKTCTACNENGLIRCPSCSSAPLSSV